MIITDQAIIINLKKTAELDLSACMYCLKLGKIYAKAKGASKITSSRLGALQPGNIISLSLHEKNNIYWVSQTKSVCSFMTKSRSLTQVNLLFYLLEFCYRILPSSQSNSNIFFEIKSAIDSIGNGQIGKFIQKEINIIKLLGYGTPPLIQQAISAHDAKQAHQLLKSYIESILEKPLESQKLFN